MSDNPYEGQWQYVVALCSGHEQSIAKANEMGAKRWELVSIQDTHGFSALWFKRPAFDNPEAHHMVHDITGAGVFDLSPPKPLLPGRDASGAPLPPPEPEPQGFAAHVAAEQSLAHVDEPG